MLAACFVNPYFYKGALYPLRIIMDTFTGQKVLMQNVHELMMPVRSNFAKFFFFWLFAILASATFVVNIKNARIKRTLIFTFAFLASYLAVRNIPIFIFFGVNAAGMNLNEARLTKNVPEKKCYIAAMLIICLLLYGFLSNKYYIVTNQSGLRKTESKFSRILMPQGACDFLEDNRIAGRMFNTLDFGPYIGYRFYPEKRIFIDTRTDLYKDEFYKLYRKSQNYPAEWRNVHKKYGFEIVLLRHIFSGTEKLLRYLHQHKDWRLVYYDGNSCVFLRDVPENSEWINRFEIDLSNKKLQAGDVDINIARFFEKIGEREFARKDYVELLEKEPKLLDAGNSLAAIYINTGRIEEGVRLIRDFLVFYPSSAELYANMGEAYLRLGKKEEALRLLERSARLNPYHRKAAYMLGLVYLERGDIDRAVRQFVKYSKLDPFNGGVHRMLGDIYTKKGLFKKAELEYNEAEALEGVPIE